MKKILLLLILVPLMAISQTIPADATALENLQITNNTTSLTATKVNVQDANGVINTIPKSDLVNVVEVNDVPSLPLIGEVGKIYVVKNVNKIYRWNGTFYQELAVTDITYQSIIDALGYTPENVVNKVTSLASPNNTTYPTTQLLKDQLDLKENVVNKQNSLVVDGSGVKYPTVDAVNLGFNTPKSILKDSKFNNFIPINKEETTYTLDLSADNWWVDKLIYTDNYSELESFYIYKTSNHTVSLGFFTIDSSNNYVYLGSYSPTNIATLGWSKYDFSAMLNKDILMPKGKRVYIAIKSTPDNCVGTLLNNMYKIYNIPIASQTSGTLSTVFGLDVGFYVQKNPITETPFLCLPLTIDTYIGDTVQIFKNSIISSIDYQNYNIQAVSSRVNGINSVGKDYTRYWEYYADASGSFTVTFYLYNDSRILLDQKTVTINVRSAVSSPLANRSIMFMGDSLTYYNRLSDEFKRVLTSADVPATVADNTNPNTIKKVAGKSLTNITCVGTQLVNFLGWTGLEKHEGYSGWEWSNFITTGSPFYFSGAINFATYKSTNSIPSIDVMYIGLGWNDIVKTQTGSLTDNSVIINNAKTFLRAVKAQMPATKVYLWTENMPGTLGGEGNHPWGSDVRVDRQVWKIKMMNLINAYIVLSQDAEFSSFVKVIGSHATFDSENMMQENTAQINTRAIRTERIGTDDVHPSDGGFFQIADSVIRSFIYNFGGI